MLHRLSGAAAVVLSTALPAVSATFTPTFDTPSFPGTQFNVESDPAYNAFYEENFGISVSNAYLYVDPRDSFDGIGIANGLREANGSAGEVGRIDFLDTTDFVDLSYSSVISGGVYEAFASDGTLLDSLATGSGTNNGTVRFDGGIISYINFTGVGGYVGISGLTYNYDGVTDGVNDDIGVSPVPVPASGLLMAGVIAAGAAFRRRRAAA
ncbi:PEP-CTERM sorting domain-containing protein [Roseobacter sp. A03A-229]